MKFFDIIAEGRVDTFKEKFGQKYGGRTDKVISSFTPKYLQWVGKHLDLIDFESNLRELSKTLKRFDEISHNLPKTDINQYKSIQELTDAIHKWDTRDKRKFKEVSGGNLVFQDDSFYMVNPLTHEASCYYGKGTKWCTAAQTDTHFSTYNREAKLFYVIDKRLKTDDPYYKVAILKRFDGGEQYWNAADIQFTSGWILGTDEYKNMQQKMTDYLNTEFAEQVKIFSDAEATKKERERAYRLAIEQERRRKQEESQERRLDGEWELGENCPDEGLKAHALLLWLQDTSDISILTYEDTLEIQRLKDEIERLNTQYDEGEDADTSILDDIESLEEELEEYEEKMDVYNIIPDGDHYDMARFEVIGLEGRSYAVGTVRETENSARDYVEQLLDDVGYEGFSQNFVMNHIDESDVENYARDMFSDFIYQDPESYIDEEYRQLSKEQQNKIRILEDKIQELRNQIERFEQMSDDDEEDLSDKIEELENMITEHEEEIESEKDNPDGDFPDDKIEEEIEHRVEDAMYNVENFISEWDLDYKQFINKRDFIEAVVEEDGYGHTLGTYDGTADEVEVQGTNYFVIRLD